MNPNTCISDHSPHDTSPVPSVCRLKPAARSRTVSRVFAPVGGVAFGSAVAGEVGCVGFGAADDAAGAELRERSPEVLAAWLRKILANELVDAARHYRRDRRDLARERSLQADPDQSASGLQGWLAADQTSPSQVAVRNEELLRLANALLELPDDMREVVVLKHLRNVPRQEIANQTGGTVPAVAGLLRRGLEKLRTALTE